MIEKRPWKLSGRALLFTALTALQYVLAFFVFKLPGLPALQWVGWGIWVLSCIFGFGPIFILGREGGVPKGKSYVHTTRLVDSGLYAIVRHPQYVAGILLNVSLMLLAQHWLIIGIGVLSASLIYLDILLKADREGLDKFGDAYREYMHRVPRANIALGIFRLLRARIGH
jgi:protein-S-isoprenylcysteine O-methyltransferase Ste14